MKNASLKSSLQSVEYLTPAFVSEPFRFSIPTRPGHRPLQFATVRTGPLCVVRPGSTWCEYCHTASATTTGANGSIREKTSIPSFCEPMKPCPSFGLNLCARTTRNPSRATALEKARSMASCAGQHTLFAEGRRSPLATRSTVLRGGFRGMGVGFEALQFLAQRRSLQPLR
jgi:hypothetical protein